MAHQHYYFMALAAVCLSGPITALFAHEQPIAVDVCKFAKAAENTLHFLQKKPGLGQSRILRSLRDREVDRVQKTLQYIIAIAEEDRDKSYQRLLDPAFVRKNFDIIPWRADGHHAQTKRHALPRGAKVRDPQNKVLLTSYAVFVVPASYQKTEQHPCALFALRDIPKNLDLCSQYSRLQLLEKELDILQQKKIVRPLAWVSQQSFDEACMQGTIMVEFPDQTQKIFAAHVHNFHRYDPTKPPHNQERYWFFKDATDPTRSHLRSRHTVLDGAGVIFAGDLKLLGMGKVLAVQYANKRTKKKELRLGILADTGGAFYENTYQLDMFAGVFRQKNLFHDYIAQFPDMVNAYILLAKESKEPLT